MSYYNEYILVVEDDVQIRNYICYSLHAEGFRHITAHTGRKALNLLVSEPVDLMLLNLGLPDVDGIGVIKKVREWSEIPIIVVSARDQDEEKAAALDLGADDFLQQSFWPAFVLPCAIFTSKAAIKYRRSFKSAVCESILTSDWFILMRLNCIPRP